MDAVLLSGFAKVKKGEKTLDLGTGTGIIPVLLSSRTEGDFFAGLEIQADCAEMAERSVRYNGLEEKIRIMQERKSSLADEIISSDAASLGTLDREELLALLT